MRFTPLIGGLAARHDQRRKARGLSRLVGSAAGVLALAASLLAIASPAGATSLPGPPRPLGGAGIQFSFGAPAVWNGTDLVTTASDTNGNLYAYEQAPGASAWTKQTVVAAGATGSNGFSPWITATSSSVQIVSQDNHGNIWFFQQTDGQTTWSAPQLVGNIGILTELPHIAWTGVPGHAGGNSVITVADGSGDVLFFYQNGSGGWTEQTVATPSAPYQYYAPSITATDKGIVIVAPSNDGTFHSWYQPYGGSGWNSDGTMGVAIGRFVDVSVTWDGTNLDVVTDYSTGQMGFLWKSDSAAFWSDEILPGPSNTQPAAGVPYIAFTGFNLVITALQQVTSSQQQVDFWWQGTTFTNFNLETVATATSPNGYLSPTVLSDGTSSGEVAVFAPFTTNSGSTYGIDDWTQPVGGTGWTPHTVAPA